MPIVGYCKTVPKKSPGIDLRVVYDPNELIVRLQDNCPAFNVERQIAAIVSQGGTEVSENLGLKTLAGMAPNTKYVHSLETNNVIMHFPIKE